MKKFRLLTVLAIAILIVAGAFTAFADSIVFWDIPEDAAYKEAVYKLVENGVLNGYPDGSFAPEGNLTRAEMCKMINLTFGYTDSEGAAGFPDLVENEWYVPYVLAAQKAGYVQGDAIGTFRPQDYISREEVCAILYRIIKPYDLPIPVTINDTVSEWAKPYVEAMVKNALMPLEEGGLFRATEPIKRHELATAVAPHSNIKVDDIKCNITFVNAETTEETVQVTIGKSLETFPTVTTVPVGHKFVGWSRSAEEPVLVDSSYVFMGDTTLYAYFDKLEYKVSFVLDGTTTVSEVTAKYNEFAAKPVDPQKTGYTFKGWSVNAKDVVDVATYPITGDTVFTAVFESQSTGGGGGGAGGGGAPVVIKYRVTFMVDSEKYGSVQEIEKGKCAKKPEEPTLEGYTFLYWSLEEGGERVDVRYHEITKDTKFYGVFELEENNPNDPSIIAALKKAVTQFNAMRLSDTKQKQVRTTVVNTIQLVLADAESGEYVDSDYVKDNYMESLQTVKKLLNKDMDKQERSDFISRVSASVDDETFNILADFFLSEETKEDYLG